MLPALRHTLACIPRYSSHSHDAECWSDSGCRIAGICDWCNVRLHEYELIPVKLTKEPVRLTGIATMQMFLYTKLYVQDPIGLKLMASRGAPESATVSQFLKLTGRCHLVRFSIFSSCLLLNIFQGSRRFPYLHDRHIQLDVLDRAQRRYRYQWHNPLVNPTILIPHHHSNVAVNQASRYNISLNSKPFFLFYPWDWHTLKGVIIFCVVWWLFMPPSLNPSHI